MRILKSLLILAFVVSIHGLLSFSYAETTVSPLGFTNVNDEQEVVETVLTLTNNGEDAVDYSVRMRAAEWGENDDDRGPLRDNRGGPDDLENIWVDHREGDCPAYNWVDIIDREGTQQIENVVDDSFHGMYELGFEFPYYGNVYNEIGMHANGFCCFVAAFEIVFHYPGWGPLPNAQPGPAASSPPPTLMAVMYQDLDPLRSGEIYYWTDERSTAIITWNDVAHWQDQGQADGEHWTFQIILNRSGLIIYQYAQIGDDDPNRPSVMVGMQNEDRDMGFSICNEDFEYLENEGVVAFGPPDAWVPWVTFDPPDGEIPGGESDEVTVAVNFEGLEEGVYFAEMIFVVNNGGIEEHIVPIIASVDSPVGDVEGTITDAANGEVVAGAEIVFHPSGLTRFSDIDGNFEVLNLPEGDYALVCTHPDYHVFTMDFLEVLGGEFSDGSMELVHSECTFNRDDIIAEVAPGENTATNFTVTNGGNAPLTYTNHRRIQGAPDVDPWDLRESLPVGQMLGDSRVLGCVFVDDLFYLSASHNQDPQIYILDRDGNQVGSFPQMGAANNGFSDMAWDGELIWGSGERVIYGFTTDGELVTSFDGPANPNANFAWDTDREVLWTCATTTNIIALDREGNQVDVINRQGLRIYGLAYWPDDPDGYPLYIFNDVADGLDLTIHKANPENGDIILVGGLEPEGGGTPTGAFITNTYDVYSWIFLANVNAGAADRIDFWHMDFRLDWFTVEPTEGVIEAGDSQEFDVVLDAIQLPGGEYEGEFVFDHDGTNGESALPVTLVVTEVPAISERTINLAMGWNLVSTNVQPDPDDIRQIMADLVDQDLLEIMKNGNGQFYNPQFDFNNIPGWNVAEGYQMKLVRAAELTISGMSVVADDPIPLHQGWNMVSYYPRVEVYTVTALSGIVDNLIMAKDGAGRFYSPQFGFCNMGNMREGVGYQLKLEQDVELVYCLEEEGDERLASVRNQKTPFLPEQTATNHNMSLLVLDQLGVDAEIGVYASDKLVGSGTLSDSKAGIAIWGDDPTTSNIDGAQDGNLLTLALFKDGCQSEMEFATIVGSNEFKSDGFWVIELLSTSATPLEFGINSAYPNPFNSELTLSYSLEERGRIDLAVFDIAGRRVIDMYNGEQTAGLHKIQINGKDLSSGVYFVELSSTGKIAKRKIVLLK